MTFTKEELEEADYLKVYNTDERFMDEESWVWPMGISEEFATVIHLEEAPDSPDGGTIYIGDVDLHMVMDYV